MDILTLKVAHNLRDKKKAAHTEKKNEEESRSK